MKIIFKAIFMLQVKIKFRLKFVKLGCFSISFVS